MRVVNQTKITAFHLLKYFVSYRVSYFNGIHQRQQYP